MVSALGMTGMGLYGSSKAALVLLTKSWAAEFGPAGVRVNAVRPGPPAPKAPSPWATHWTSWAAGAGRSPRAARGDRRGHRFPHHRPSQLIHGAVLPVDGGRLAV
jgi:NAD(P)-dependent dehydrogenase (short-subunit alcohol dehydrogenase family)